MRLGHPPRPAYAGALAAALVALAAGGCGDSAAVAVPPQSAPSAAIPPAPGPAIASTYAGLGARSAVFVAHHQGSRGRGPGVRLVRGLVVDRGDRVSAYDVQFNDHPPLSDRDRLVSATGLEDLPPDRITVTVGVNCRVYGSPSLKRLLGLSYAQVTTVAGTTTARVQSSARPGC